MDILTGPGAPHGISISENRQQALREVAVELEASFLAEMLKSAGLGQGGGEFGGGVGEDQYTSFLVRAQAREMARAGGIGLAETVFHALMEMENDR